MCRFSPTTYNPPLLLHLIFVTYPHNRMNINIIILLFMAISLVMVDALPSSSHPSRRLVPSSTSTSSNGVVVVVEGTNHQEQHHIKNTFMLQKQHIKWNIGSRRKKSRGDTSTTVGVAAVVASDAVGAADQNDHSGPETPPPPQNQWGMTVALCTSYFTVMGAKCALPSVLSLLLSPEIGLTFPMTTTTTLVATSPQQMMAQQLTIATLSVAIGKLILGPIIDEYGGKRSLQVALFSLFTCLLVISFCQSFIIFGIAWIFIDFIFSACWPACISTIHDYYTTPTDWSTQIGYLAAAARAGNTMAFLLFATIIHIVTKHIPYIQQTWRPVFLVAASIQLIPFTLLSIYGTRHERRHNTTTTTPETTTTVATTTVTGTWKTPNILSAVMNVLRHEARNIDFWFHLINRSMLMIYGSFLLFVPTYMTQIFHTTNAYGAQIGSLYALGCLGSVTTLSKYYPTLMKRTKLWCITMLLFFGAAGSSLLQLAHVSGYIHLSTFLSSILLFTWGFSFAVPFYIPPSLYALSRGGTTTKESSSRSSTATITDIFDIGGFTLLAMFNGYVTGIQHSQLSAWIPTFAITTSCAMVSYLALFITTWRE